jgi:hypothetical protein
MHWETPTTEQEADQILQLAWDSLPNLIEDELEGACKTLALFAGSFNHVWTSKRRSQLIDLLVMVGFDAVDPVLEVLVDHSRAEQFDVTNTFIRRMVQRK